MNKAIEGKEGKRWFIAFMVVGYAVLTRFA